MSEQNETVFGEGFIFKRPHENAPEFVKGSMSIKADEAIAFLQKYKKADGWVNLDLLASKDNTKLYFKLNTYVPKPKEEIKPAAQPQASESVLPEYPADAVAPEDIPFN